jgi:hypothetical protein
MAENESLEHQLEPFVKQAEEREIVSKSKISCSLHITNS